MRPAQPSGYAVAQAFMQNVLENTGKGGDSNQGKPVVFARSNAGTHGIPYSIGRPYSRECGWLDGNNRREGKPPPKRRPSILFPDLGFALAGVVLVAINVLR